MIDAPQRPAHDQPLSPAAHTLLSDRHLRLAALAWCALWPGLYAVHLLAQRRVGWTDGVDRPFGEDALNFWAAARLAVEGRVAQVYDFAAFHAAQVAAVGAPIDLYHYSYPPTLIALTAPLGLLPYPLGWAVWQCGGWLAFAASLRALAVRHWLLVALAWPAVAINAMSGQIGCWLAAAVGWGMVLLPRRPVAAGLVLSLLAIKPPLAWLVPLALLAGREWRAFAALVVGALGLALLATLWFGPAAWSAYADKATILRRVILEDGTGVWHRMISVFVLVRHVGAPVAAAYAVQLAAALAVAALVLPAWRRGSPARGALLGIGMVAGAPYVSDYDCVLLAAPAAWAWHGLPPSGRPAVVIAIVLPLVAAPLAQLGGTAFGALLVWPLLIGVARDRGKDANDLHS